MVLIETKKQQLSAIVNAYQALGGGNVLSVTPVTPVPLVTPVPAVTPVPLVTPVPPATLPPAPKP